MCTDDHVDRPMSQSNVDQLIIFLKTDRNQSIGTDIWAKGCTVVRLTIPSRVVKEQASLLLAASPVTEMIS